MNTTEMKEIKATVAFEFDFSDMISEDEIDRAENGLPPMSESEVREWVERELEDYDFSSSYYGGADLKIQIS